MKSAIERMELELAQINRGLAVLECIRFTALHDNHPGVDLADALTVAIDAIANASTKLDALTPQLRTKSQGH